MSPRMPTRNDFFIVLHEIFAKRVEVSDIHCVKDAKVPLMMFKFEGISVDLPYAQLQVITVPENVDILNPLFLNGIDEFDLQNVDIYPLGLLENQTMRDAIPKTARHFIFPLHPIRSQLETACPGVVSCADIVALAARDSVVQTGGRSWQVPLGRRDGLVSQASDTANLPAFNDPISVQISKFADKGLNTQDLVTLVGGHTIGTSACAFISVRLYNFNNTNGPDPDINQAFLPQLRALCPDGGDGSRRVALDTGSVNSFGSSYYENLRNGRGVIESDAKLWSDRRTQRYVRGFLGQAGSRFNAEFGRAMVKMGNVEVKTGRQGEIRRVCTATN
ncbi:hypothetical protein L1987_31994 [Smallanthus sonchifolius]|uniref:Uncharacterized protein n=1 Tax=Smallanthus sonchifolius TaxID=185202 RepID=A0ACB9I9V4_9ASTR|nr:hypothetical protein L1987_31994 [Smallanthus sonchifolius]